MSFCGKCGTPLNGEKFCSNCGAANELMVNAAPKRRQKQDYGKKAALGIAAVVITIFVIIGFTDKAKAPNHFTNKVNRSCEWCGNSPSVAYKMSDGSYSYICKKCSRNCAWCGERATRHYENLLNTMVFVCNDCYKEISED